MNKTYKYIFSFVLSALAAVPSFAQSGEEIIYEGDVNAIHIGKRVDTDKDGQKWLRLESFVSGSETKSDTRKPVDFVLVLDMSGSMGTESAEAGTYYRHRSVSLSYQAPTTYYDNTVGYIYYSNYYYCQSLSSGASTRGCYYYLFNGSYYKISHSSFQPGTQFPDETWYAISIMDGTTTYYIVDENTALTKEQLITKAGDDAEYHAKLQSASENQYSGTLYSKTKMGALLQAADSFVDVVETDNTKSLGGSDDGHRISIVKFANTKSTDVGDNVYGSQVTVSGVYHYAHYNYSQIVSKLQPMSKASDIRDAISGLRCGGGTYSSRGLDCALDEINGSDGDREKVVILFTDGMPGTSSEKFDDSEANKAITKAKALKTEKGVTVYSIGIFDTSTYNSFGEKIDTYMRNVSSNYPNANSMTESGSWASNDYYKRVTKGDDLTEIFKSIASSEVSKKVGYKLQENSVVKDVVSDDFKLPEGTDESSIIVCTFDCNGIDTDGNFTFAADSTAFAADIAISGKSVTVTNFDFAENFCRIIDYTDTEHVQHKIPAGKKLVLRIPFVVDPEKNDGGAALNTNGPGSGIYLPGQTEPLKEFVSPVLPMPNLVIKKTGMKPGESEVFYVYEGTDTSVKPLYTVIVKEGADGIGHAVLVRLEPGTYTVKESSWNWAYDDDVTSITETVDLSTESETEFVLPGGNKKVKGTHFYFEGLENESSPLHGEDSQNNIFDLSK